MDDINATQVVGQMMGAELISAHGARRIHPHVSDPDGEERRLLIEGLQSMELAALARRQHATGHPARRHGPHGRTGGRRQDAQCRGAPGLQGSSGTSGRDTGRATGRAAGAEQMPGLANPGEGMEAGGMAQGLVSPAAPTSNADT